MRSPMALARWLAVSTVLLLVAAPVRGQLSKDELACQQAASKQAGTFLGKKIKCLVACDKQALKGKTPAASCLPPFGGTTLECVTKTATKALAGVAKACADDCPECYAGGDCDAGASALLAAIEARIDTVAPLVRCDDAASPDGLTKAEAKARQRVALVVGKFVTASEKCLAKCRKAEGTGKIALGACVYGAEADDDTIECLIKAATKAFDVIEDPELDAPECLAPELTFALPIASGLIEEFDPLIFCASPGGAFVDQTPILR
jgi:hypothetical protein